MILGAVLGLLLFQQFAPLEAHTPTPPVLKLESRLGGFGVSDEVEISFHPQPALQGEASWSAHVKRDYRGPPGQFEQLDRWIDGRSCPAVALAADALRDFRAPGAYGPGGSGRAAVVMPHGTSYVLTAVGAANGGQSTTVTTDLTGSVLGALAAATLSQLRTCL